MKKNKLVLLSPTRVAQDQRDWLNKKSEETGNSMAVILRGLIKAEMDKEGGK